jgi:hypothetical protein
MENQQMAMPAEMAPAGPNPEEMAVYDRMRQEISPQEFSNEMLASASQVDPQAVAEFTEELQSLDISPEELDALNDLVDEILASPEQYEELRQKYLAQGLPEDILPEQFDPNFFAAMNMAVDQMIAAPTGVQAFAEGGIAELKPIAKAIASYGRNGDTMLAHITPAEARMLRRRGGSGTINPHTGLPEFFLKKAFKSIGKAVKKFASSTVGRLVTTVALGFFLGPAAASMVGATSAAGVAAVSGFVGSAGSTLLGGGNLKDALKAGAVGGLTAGAGAGIMGGSGAFQAGSYTGPTTVGGQFDKFKSAITPGAPVAPTPGLDAAGQAPVPSQGDIVPKRVGVDYAASQAPGPINPGPGYDPTNMAAASPSDFGAAPPGAAAKPSLFEQGKQLYNENISPSGIRAGATPGAQQAGIKAVTDYKTQMAAAGITPTDTALTGVYNKAFNAAMPGIMGTYGPMAAVGLGTMAAFGGFDSKPVQGGDITKSLNTPVNQRIREQGTQSQMYLQGLPGVVYDDYGAPVFGKSTRLPTYDVPDYNLGGFGGQGIMNLPTSYTQPRGYEGGGDVVAEPAKPATTPAKKTPEELAAERKAATEAMMAQQKAGRDKANQARAQRLAAGSGQMYGNINAGLAALAPENFPGAVDLSAARKQAIFDAFDKAKPTSDIDYARVMQQQGFRPEEVAAASGRSYGDINRRYSTALRQDAAAPMLQGQRTAMDQQAGIAASGQLPRDVSMYSGQEKAELYRGLARQGMTDAQIRAAAENKYGMQRDVDWQGLQRTVADPTLNTQRPTSAASGPATAAPPGASMYSNITGPQPVSASPNLYAQTLAMGMPSRDAMLPAYQYTPLAKGATTRPASTYSTGNTPASEAARRQAQYQALLGQGATDAQIRFAGETMFGPQASAKPMNMGGIAGLAQGGYPRRTGQISGPGTEKSDSIPAMLSDGEFVMTAKAVRGAGKGSRRAGAKQMYKLMHQLEKNSERG